MKTQIISIIALLLVSFSYADLNDGLVGYWTLDGNANDSSGHGYHGTVEGTTLVEDRFGNPNSAYSFDGINDRIVIWRDRDIPIVSGKIVSIQAWFNTTSLLAGNGNYNNPIVSKLWNGVNYYIGGTLETQNKIEFATPTGMLTSDEELNDGQWHHVVGVYDGTLSSDNLKLYVDGVLQSKTDNDTYDVGTLNILAIGANVKWTGESFYPYDFFKGIIDDVRIYDRALSTEEIGQLYVPEPCTLLLLGVGGLMIRKK